VVSSGVVVVIDVDSVVVTYDVVPSYKCQLIYLF